MTIREKTGYLGIIIIVILKGEVHPKINIQSFFIFTVVAKLHALARNSSEVDAQARPHVEGVNKVFSDQCLISELPETCAA